MLGLIALVFVCFFLSDFNDLQINSSYLSWLFPLGGALALFALPFLCSEDRIIIKPKWLRIVIWI